MAIRDTWHRALVYFGLADDPDYIEDAYEPETGQSDIYESLPPRTAPGGRVGERAGPPPPHRQQDRRAARSPRRDRRHLRRRRRGSLALAATCGWQRRRRCP